MAQMMDPHDVQVHRCDIVNGELFVVSRHGTQGYGWPKTIEHSGLVFAYHGNEPLSYGMASHFGGHAKYVINH